jgi:hypothetical protein
MKKEIAIGSMILFLLFAPLTKAVFAGGVDKQVCHEVQKKGKTVQECKTIKVHKKLEGTAVPDKK